MSDFWRQTVRNASTQWLLDQIRMTNILIFEGEQLLRGQKPEESQGLRDSIRISREDVRLMREEVQKREMDIR